MNESEWDKLLNIDTVKVQQGYPKIRLYHRYEPTPYSGLEMLFQRYELPKDAACVDFGCGKGRVPIYLHHRFSIQTKGIEMDDHFYADAVTNLKRYMKKHHVRKDDIQFFHMFAEEYEVSTSDNVFFFFNPFSIHIFRKVFQNIMRSKECMNRPMVFIFYYPSDEYCAFLNEQKDLSFLQEVRLMHEKNIDERFLVYESK